MSRIGKKGIPIPQGVGVDLKDGLLVVKGPKGELKGVIPPSFHVGVKSNHIFLTPIEATDVTRPFYGLLRTKINNMITGVFNGFQKQLAIYGVGYSAKVTGSTLTLLLGYSHSIVYQAPLGINFSVEEQPKAAGSDLQCFVFVKGCDRELVGQVAATLRDFRPPEPYKGKGVRYAGEYVRRKAGKAAAAAGGAKA